MGARNEPGVVATGVAMATKAAAGVIRASTGSFAVRIGLLLFLGSRLSAVLRRDRRMTARRREATVDHRLPRMKAQIVANDSGFVNP